MDHSDYLIAGGGIGAVTAAETIRSLDANGTIALISEEAHPLYSRVLLPHYVKGRIPREKLFLRSWNDYREKSISVRAGRRAVGLNAVGRAVTLDDGASLGFTKLLIATGGQPRTLDIPGGGLKGVSRLQTVEDADLLLTLLDGAKKAAVLGSGFIALEYAEIFRQRGIAVSLVAREPHLFHRNLDAAGGEFIARLARACGVTVIANDGVAGILGQERALGVATTSGKTIPADILGLGIGLDRNLEWLRASGIALGERGIQTDVALETSVPGIFAAGDAAEFPDARSGVRHIGGNWTNAALQGAFAGRHMAGAPRQIFDRVSSYTISAFGVPIALVGDPVVRPGVSVAGSIDPARSRYARFFLTAGRLTGAVLINRPTDTAAVTKLIQTGSNLAAWSERLSDPRFDMGELSA